MGTQIAPAFFWRVNSSTVANYAFEPSHITFPRSVNINTPIDGVTIEIISASTNPPGGITIDINSLFNVSDVSVLNGASLHCADSVMQRHSNMIIIEVDETLGIGNCMDNYYHECIVVPI